MPANIEIKARVADLNRLRVLAEGLSDAPARLIEQQDTYFNCPNGRLKLRQIKGQTAQLIFYRRPDSSASKLSDYTISEIPYPNQILAILAAALGIRATVVKTRTLFIVGQTRIHLDSVEGLGSFMELEVVLQDSQSAEEGHAITRKLVGLLEISEGDLLAGSYADLLNESNNLKTIKMPQQERGDSTTGSAIVVCLCGSSRWPELHHRAMLEETLAGNIVIPMGLYGHADYPPGAKAATNDGDEATAVKQMLDRLHYRKIDLADEIIIVSEDDYFGSSTRREIAYAQAQGKRVRHWQNSLRKHSTCL